MADRPGYVDALKGLGEMYLKKARWPELHGVVWRNVRALRLRKFTYVVYYRVHDDRVEVLAVMHGSRDASAWQARA